LQDWQGSSETAPLRWQAAYNEAIVWRSKGSYTRAVLMLTELLGERAPDTEQPFSMDGKSLSTSRLSLPDEDTMRFPARLARLAAFAQYTLEDWTILPQQRIQLLIGDAERLVADIKQLAEQRALSERQQRTVQYVQLETLRAIGHVELLRIISGPAAHLYDKDHRPVGLRKEGLDTNERERLEQAIKWMSQAEQVLPTSTLYCDLAEANLLLKQFAVAGGYARHATLEKDRQSERAFYLAAESYLLEDTDDSRAVAKKYAQQFSTPTLPEFVALRKELHIDDDVSAVKSAHA
jgi:hypothetical protein